MAEHARAARLDIEVVRLIVGEDRALKTLGRYRGGAWLYTAAAFARIAEAIREPVDPKRKRPARCCETPGPAFKEQ